jgi:hypothetical protein
MTKSWVRQPAAGAAVVLACAVVLAACGGGGGGGASGAKTASSATTTTAAGNRQAALAAFRSCMQSHGVTLPANSGLGGVFRGGGGAGDTNGSSVPNRTFPSTTLPPGVTSQQWQAALAACQSQLPARGTGNGGNGANFANNPQVQVYYNCLQTYLMTHGATTLPPLGQAGARGLFGGGPGSSTTTADPTLQAAQAHCAALRPTFGGGSTTTTVK